MDWWVWLLFGLLLLILEVQAFGNFYLMFFGTGALLVGLLTAVGLVEAAWLQWLLFTVLSLVALVSLRARILSGLSTSASAKVDSLVGETAIVVDDIAGGAVGQAELRGTVWSAHNAGTVPLPKSSRCRVERVEGLTLWLRPE